MASLGQGEANPLGVACVLLELAHHGADGLGVGPGQVTRLIGRYRNPPLSAFP